MARRYTWDGLATREMIGRRVIAADDNTLVLSALHRVEKNDAILLVTVSNVSNVPRWCPICDVQFECQTIRRVYCSRKCQNAAYTQKRGRDGRNKRSKRQRKKAIAQRARLLESYGITSRPVRRRRDDRLVPAHRRSAAE